MTQNKQGDERLGDGSAPEPTQARPRKRMKVKSAVRAGDGVINGHKHP